MSEPQLTLPVEILLGKPRKLLFDHQALCSAEREINKQRGVAPAEFVSIDFLMISSARAGLSGSGGFPRDLIAVMLWAGLLREDPKLTVSQAEKLIDQSPLPHGEIVDLVWEAYARAAARNKNLEPETSNVEQEPQYPPLAPRPGSSS